MKRILLFYALGITIITMMPCCTKSSEHSDTSTAKPSAGIVATVGSASVTTEDLTLALKTMSSEQQFEYTTDEGKRVLIDMLMDWKLLSQEAVKAGLEKDKEVKASLKNTSGSPCEQEQVLGSAYLHYRIKQLPPVTDEQIKTYFTGHPAEFALPARIRIQRILFAGRQQAQQAVASLKEGETFDRYQHKHQENKITVDSLWLQQRDNCTDMESAAFRLTGSQLSDILPVAGGYCLVRVEQREPARNKTLQEASQSIRTRLQVEQEKDLIQKIRTDLRQGKSLTINESALQGYRCAECEGRAAPAEVAPGLEQRQAKPAGPAGK